MGGVLVFDGSAYFLAGRSSYLNGGIDLYKVQPETGKVLARRTIYSPDPLTGRQPKQYGPGSMPGEKADVLVAGEELVYLRETGFDKRTLEKVERTKPHLLTLTGFLDDTWAHRSYWIFNTKCSLATGCTGRKKGLIYGRLLSVDGSKVYGYGRAWVHWSNQLQDKPYRLFAVDASDGATLWESRLPIRARALVLAGDVLFVAGPVEGDGETLLIAVSAEDGRELARYRLQSSPVFDGMAAAYGRLYISYENGSVACWGG